MRKVLVTISAVNGQMQSATAEAVAIYREEAAEIHLLNVQTTVPRFVAGYFNHGNLRLIQEECGMDELAPAKALLDSAGVPCVAHVKAGRNAETIVRVAREIGCDRIVIGQAEHADFAQKLFGTLASQVRHLIGGTGNCIVIGS
jgi:nucleotide-binding universal stress UspA family protein